MSIPCDLRTNKKMPITKFLYRTIEEYYNFSILSPWQIFSHFFLATPTSKLLRSIKRLSEDKYTWFSALDIDCAVSFDASMCLSAMNAWLLETASPISWALFASPCRKFQQVKFTIHFTKIQILISYFFGCVEDRRVNVASQVRFRVALTQLVSISSWTHLSDPVKFWPILYNQSSKSRQYIEFRHFTSESR